MTDRHHAGDDAEIPGLEEIHEDVDPADPSAADELLEGLLGADVAERDDISAPERVAAETNPSTSDTVEETPTGRWVCRFCETERRSPSGAAAHHATCPDSQHYRGTHWDNDKTDTEVSNAPEKTTSTTDEMLDAGGDSPSEQQTFLVNTQWHEFRAYLKFARHGLDPYYALHSLMRRTDWSDGPPTEIIEYGNHKYEVTFTFDESGLEPWDDPSFHIEKVREFRLHVETAEGIRKADFYIRPRWPDMESKPGMRTPSNPAISSVSMSTRRSEPRSRCVSRTVGSRDAGIRHQRRGERTSRPIPISTERRTVEHHH